MLALNQLTLYWRAGQSKFQIIVVVKTFNIKSTLKILGTQHSTVKNRYTVAQQISGIYSSWITETLYQVQSNCPFLPPVVPLCFYVFKDFKYLI